MAEHTETIDVVIEVGGSEYLLLTSNIDEAVSHIGSLRCELTGLDERAPDPLSLIGKKVKYAIVLRNSGARREFNGVVVEAVRCMDATHRPLVRVVVTPRLWRLSKRTDCRIFQEMAVPDIIKQVCTDAGVPEGDQEWKLNGNYAPRTYCCQYRESDFDFIMRLMVEEGIIFAILHQDGSDKVVFTDDGSGVGDVAPKTLPFRTLMGFDPMLPEVMNLKRRRSVRSDKVSLRHYDFERPKYKLEASKEGVDDGEKTLEVYRYPGRFIEDADGERLAQALLDAIQSQRDVMSGDTTTLSLRPGHRFVVEQHPFEEFNQEWMVVSMDTVARNTAEFQQDNPGRDFMCDFTAVPTGSTCYKAPRRPVTSQVVGIHTAFTTGPGGSEIHPDEYGRVKMRFHWDRSDPSDDKSSCWVRTEQPNTPDSMLLPRVGWEVTVRYGDGDVDAPVCFGRLYNALAPPPYGLPAAKARSSLQTATSPGDGSSNELRMDDSGGAEEMFINASKDLTINVGNNMTLSIGNNETREIGSNHTLAVTNSVHVTVGSNQTFAIGGDQEVKVETFMLDDIGGDHSLTIGGNRDLKVGGDHKRTVTGNAGQQVDGSEFDLVVGKVEEKVDGNWEHSVGLGLLEMTGGNRSYKVVGNRTEKTGLAKIVATNGGRGVEIGGNLTTKVAGAIVNSVKGDKSNKAGSTYTEVVAGAQIVKAKDVTYEGESLVAVVMGASTLIVSSPAIMLAGTSVKWDGATKDSALLIVDN